MPKKRSPSTLETIISQVLQRAMLELASAINEAGASSSTAAPIARAPKKTTAKKPGRVRARKPVVTLPVVTPPPVVAQPAPAAPVGSPAAKTAPPKKRGAKDPGKAGGAANHTEKVLLVIRAEPGLRAEQIERLAELPKAAVQAALLALRKDGRVKVQGKARGMMYTAV